MIEPLHRCQPNPGIRPEWSPCTQVSGTVVGTSYLDNMSKQDLYGSGEVGGYPWNNTQNWTRIFFKQDCNNPIDKCATGAVKPTNPFFALPTLDCRLRSVNPTMSMALVPESSLSITSSQYSGGTSLSSRVWLYKKGYSSLLLFAQRNIIPFGTELFIRSGQSFCCLPILSCYSL